MEALLDAVSGLAGTEVEVVAGGAASGSPGMLTRHYAPLKPLTLIAMEGGEGRARLASAAADAVRRGERPGLLCTSEDAAAVPSLGAVAADLGPEGDDAEIARRLFSAMRDLDRDPAVTILLARVVPERGLGAAVNDRLRRAAVLVIEE